MPAREGQMSPRYIAKHEFGDSEWIVALGDSSMESLAEYDNEEKRTMCDIVDLVKAATAIGPPSYASPPSPLPP